VSNHLDRPLGQERKHARASKPRLGQAIAALCVLALAGSASWFALEGLPFAEPVPPKPLEPVASAPAIPKTLTPEEQAKADEKALETASNDKVSQPLPAGGAKIIRVNPDGASTPGIIRIGDPNKVTQDARVAHIPDPDLVEKTDDGQLPKRAQDGRRPFDVYARPWSGTRGARVAIVIGGMGVSQTSTQTAIDKLPPEITLGFAPQGNSLSRWAQAARKKGHEILLQLPMEPFDYPRVDPGRGTLIVDAAADANLKVLHESMGRLTNYAGVMNYLGARFTSEPAALEPVLKEIGARGLYFLDDGTSARSQTDALSGANRAPFAAGDIVIDQTQDKAAILKSLDQLEATARAKGSAIGIGTGFDVTVDAVTEWAKQAQKRGIEIVGVASLARDPEQ
jgi:uncharacterized protein